MTINFEKIQVTLIGVEQNQKSDIISGTLNGLNIELQVLPSSIVSFLFL